MINYNDTSIVSGYIKELLHSFNLPTVKVVKDKELILKDCFYLYKNKIRRAIESTSNISASSFYKEDAYNYVYGSVIPNLTKNLITSNNIYDSYTHEYLGEYLRFIRDYKELDLMPLYNCFSNRMPKLLNLKSNNDKIIFSSYQNNYKIYMIPIKLFKKYTIAIEEASSIELICGLYDETLFSNVEGLSFESLYSSTYLKKVNSIFSKPFIYDKMFKYSENMDPEGLVDKKILSSEKNLKLFIKIPFNNTSTITVLEGEYANNNQFIIDDGFQIFNKSIINYEESEIKKIPLKSKLQLLNMNSHVSHPFSDKLIEYLSDNAITLLDNIPDNIIRIQQKLLDRKRKNQNKIGLSSIKNRGIWEDKYRDILYDIAKQEGILNNKFDILGYVDKEIEQILGADIDIYNNSDTKKKYDERKGVK